MNTFPYGFRTVINTNTLTNTTSKVFLTSTRCLRQEVNSIASIQVQGEEFLIQI